VASRMTRSTVAPRGARAGKRYRGSRKRIREIDWRAHTPVSLWVLLLLTLGALVVTLSWLGANATP
jgi:hypothetical protein